MLKTLQYFLLRLAGATDSELAQQVEYLRTENRILRAKLPKRIEVTPQEKSHLVKLGKALGSALKDLISIVSPRTFLLWVNAEQVGQPRTAASKGGRPRKPADLRELILRLARENSWGYTRILGELKRLGIHSVSKSTVKNILKEAGLDPGPKRGEGTWHDFLKRHAETLWQCDFFTDKVWTMSGLVDIFVLFFIQIGSRRVFVSGMTAHPDRAWMMQQARNVSMFFADQEVKPPYLVRDNDSKYVKEFDDILRSDKIDVVRTCIRAPNMAAFAERWVQSIRQECLSHFVFFGEKHLHHVISAYLHYYHEARPHQGLDNVPPYGSPPDEDIPVSLDDIQCFESLGGLLKSYAYRPKAAA